MPERENQLISVIIPVYNRRKLLAETLESVLSQTYENWECIIVDDGSSDGSQDIAKKYASKDPRYKFSERKRLPKGASTCRNIGIDSSVGEFVIFLDSDDILGAECLEYRIEKAQLLKDQDAIIFQTQLFTHKIGDSIHYWNKLTSESNDLERFINFDMPWSIMGPIWRKNKLVYFNENTPSMQDWEMHIRQLLSGMNYKIVADHSPTNVCYCRVNGELNSIGLNFHSKTKMLSRFPILLETFNIFSSKEVSKQTLAINRYLLRMAINYRKNDLTNEATSLIGNFDYFKRNVHNRLIRFYIKNYDKTFLRRLIEVYVYKVLKKGNLFDPPTSYFLTHV